MSTSMKTACGWCLREGHAKEKCETKKFSLRRDGERAAECMAAKRWQKGPGKKEAVNSMEVKEETASHASIDPSSPAMSHWNTDTGASRHILPITTGSRIMPCTLFRFVLQIIPSSIQKWVGDSGTRARDWGERSTVVNLLNTLHIPALHNNLLSPYHLTCKKGFKISIVGSDVTFHQHNKIRFTATVNDSNIAMLMQTTQSFLESANSSSTSTCYMDDTLWHKQCCHRNIDTIQWMHAKQLVTGMKLESGPPADPILSTMSRSKQHHHTSLMVPQSEEHACLSLFTVISKVQCQLQHQEGYRYWVTFICSASDIWGLSLLKYKSDAFAAFKQFKAYAENAHPRLKIVEFQEDKGVGVHGKGFDDFCADHGIKRHHTEPDEPYQNGVAEWANRMIAEAATAMLNKSHLPPSFWGHAVEAFIHVQNHIPTDPLPDSTPFTEWDHGHHSLTYPTSMYLAALHKC